MLPLRRGTRRRPGPWRIVEIFAWACQLTIVAARMGWDAHQPITAPAFDLLTVQGRNEARAHLVAVDPDFVALSPPRTAWSRLQHVDQRRPMRVRRQRRERTEHRMLLSFADEVLQWQPAGVRAAMVVDHAQSTAWSQPPMHARS